MPRNMPRHHLPLTRSPGQHFPVSDNRGAPLQHQCWSQKPHQPLLSRTLIIEPHFTPLSPTHNPNTRHISPTRLHFPSSNPSKPSGGFSQHIRVSIPELSNFPEICLPAQACTSLKNTLLPGYLTSTQFHDQPGWGKVGENGGAKWGRDGGNLATPSARSDAMRMRAQKMRPHDGGAVSNWRSGRVSDRRTAY